MNLIKQHLLLEGEPLKIGTISDVHGHPNTGWPAQEQKKSGGCLSVVATIVVLIIPVIILIIQNSK